MAAYAIVSSLPNPSDSHSLTAVSLSISLVHSIFLKISPWSCLWPISSSTNSGNRNRCEIRTGVFIQRPFVERLRLVGDPSNTLAHRTHPVDRMSYDGKSGRIIDSRHVPYIPANLTCLSIAFISFAFSGIFGLICSFPRSKIWACSVGKSSSTTSQVDRSPLFLLRLHRRYLGP